DQDSGLYWFHTHSHEHLEEQLYRGLSGLLIVSKPGNLSPELAGLQQRDITLKHFRVTNGALNEEVDANAPDTMFTVNGQLEPTMTIRPGETQIWNIANVNDEGFYKIRLEGQPFYVIGQDGHPFDSIQVQDSLIIGPAMRFSVLVQGAARGTTHLVLDP